MKLKYEIDLEQLFDGTHDEDIIDFIATHDVIIDEVAKQIVTGYTSSYSHGGRTWDLRSGTPLDRARRAVADGASEVAKITLAEAQRAVEHAEKSRRDAWDEAAVLRTKVTELRQELRSYRHEA